MDPSRDPFLRRQILSQQPMSLATSLPSGQSFYTVESLEGATSLFLQPAPPASLPRRDSFPPSLPDRDALLRLDAQQRALLADRETLDARARLLAAERESLLRNMPGGPTALPNQSMYAEALDVRSRVSLDGLQNLDPRSRALLDNGRVHSHGLEVRPGAPLSDNRGLSHGLETRPRDPLQLGVRAPPVVGGITPGVTEHGPLSELLRGREFGVGAPFLPAADPTLGWRDIGRAEVLDVGAQSARLFANGSREPAAMRSAPAEVKKPAERNKGLSSAKPSSAPAKIKPPEQSDGWCAVCKIDCNNIKTLGIHVNGKKHRAALELLQGNMIKAIVNPVPSTSQADKKRASDEQPEASQSAKRLKASTPVVASMAGATGIQKAKADSKQAKPTATKVLSNPSHQFCEICNISTTGKTNLESHLKGKRHAARVKELANPPLVVSAT